MDGDERTLVVPNRPDGTPRVFWYDREGGHVIHLRRDGSLMAFSFDCRHEVEATEVE